MKLKILLITGLFFAALQGYAQKKVSLSSFPLHTILRNENKPMVVYLSGDGGWNKFSQNLCHELSESGYAVLALDTRKYFWSQKSPVQFAGDMEAIIEHYMQSWGKSSFIVMGYSFGADAGAFLPGNFSGAMNQKLKSLVLLSPGFSTGFVTKISNMLGFGGTDKDKYKVLPELKKSPVPVYCIFGKEEDSDFYEAIKPVEKIHKILVPGSHRYDDNVKQLARYIEQGF